VLGASLGEPHQGGELRVIRRSKRSDARAPKRSPGLQACTAEVSTNGGQRCAVLPVGGRGRGVRWLHLDVCRTFGDHRSTKGLQNGSTWPTVTSRSDLW